uniref:Uncharacterized protein n=1 Tax=Ditylum brightwellii TaxID=49249 RepID=A0A7S4RYC1_9STRA|mmetsp:Transcript_29790/g.39763  ORF Transcript_29790/g.39763 Transcript_29790/m.39763 type:complete len:178 (-) Transcript_29790:118-651(-)
MPKVSVSLTSDTPVSKPAHDDNKRDTLTKSSSTLSSLFKKPFKAVKGKFKKRRNDNAHQPPDQNIKEEDKPQPKEEKSSSRKGGEDTREHLQKCSSMYYETGVIYFAMKDYEKAQEYFLKTLSARKMLYGASSHKVMEVQESLGYTALLQGDRKKADYHFDIVERRGGVRPMIELVD